MASLDWFFMAMQWKKGASVSPTTAFLIMSMYTYTEWFLKLTFVTSVGLVRLPRFTFPFSPSWRDRCSGMAFSICFTSLIFQFGEYDIFPCLRFDSSSEGKPGEEIFTDHHVGVPFVVSLER